MADSGAQSQMKIFRWSRKTLRVLKIEKCLNCGRDLWAIFGWGSYLNSSRLAQEIQQSSCDTLAVEISLVYGSRLSPGRHSRQSASG
jgi:hypothetical protein